VSKEKTERKYGEVVERLGEIVKRLEGGELTLEDSIAHFEEGMKLVKAGEQILADADARIEQLLSEDGKTAPLKLPDTASSTPAASAARKAPPSKAADDDDVPF
jgi:exodeoxyribonuclease VII small subunit